MKRSLMGVASMLSLCCLAVFVAPTLAMADQARWGPVVGVAVALETRDDLTDGIHARPWLVVRHKSIYTNDFTDLRVLCWGCTASILGSCTKDEPPTLIIDYCTGGESVDVVQCAPYTDGACYEMYGEFDAKGRPVLTSYSVSAGCEYN